MMLKRAGGDDAAARARKTVRPRQGGTYFIGPVKELLTDKLP
jgi:hypothetical protein